MGARRRFGFAVALATAMVLAVGAVAASQELPPGWGAPDSTTTSQPPNDEPASPEPEPEQPTPPPTTAPSPTPPSVEDRAPEPTTAEREIANALRPSCDDPWTHGFFVLHFPQPDKQATFSDDFGVARPDERRHRGVDIFSEKGEPVVAIAGGTVRRISTGPRTGHFIVLEHEGGWESRYLHLNNDSPDTDDGRVSLADAVADGIEEGAEVAPGQLLGWVGDSGNAEATPAHTHFELLRHGRLADPVSCLVKAWHRQLRLWALDGILL